jgi:DNA-binding FadR family transcriptional regulator
LLYALRMMPSVRGGPAKYARIAADLRLQIITGQLGLGDRVPSEPELTDRYHVSKTTAARALEVLSAEGVIERRPGSGSYVIRVPPSAVVVEVWPECRVTADSADAVLVIQRPGTAPPERYPADTTVIVVVEGPGS